MGLAASVQEPMTDLTSLPDDLPVPVDDGAADHLLGRGMPRLALLATSDELVALDRLGAGRSLYRRLTLVVGDGYVEHVFYPIFPPNQHAREVLAWLDANSRTGAPRPDHS